MSMSDLELIEARAAALREELEELERAARVLRKLRAANPGKHLQNGTQTAADYAWDVLRVQDPNGEGLHYSDIAEAAVELGCTSPADTLRRRMNRRKDQFEQLGGGVYRLVPKGKK